MTYRTALVTDIKQLHEVRMSVKENVLINTALVTDDIYADYLTRRGKGWLCETDDSVVGFAIADIEKDSIWALFVRPEYEGRGIGRKLHNDMLDWYFALGKDRVWLSTAPATRAETFYRAMGWKETSRKYGEIFFELAAESWHSRPV